MCCFSIIVSLIEEDLEKNYDLLVFLFFDNKGIWRGE